ncbi:hypothetical protein BJ684DRAFT_15376 [Piptocephalis cylindrospora]|uniref:PCFS4-like zinc finger domain-containing protein n=1 Tax=Piptocephalis cylindrospora TaxID=1907219 RepID=A0A4P9Y5H8_9FUNG|nr:hypothetical protein BJ684DRAFT_15376 [Piptocephalis cylindrospora]|eukprot:RKP14278.1 hypothetical protein BJ684DRAFT_15376 [Piptocephalis cylindrospora]
MPFLGQLPTNVPMNSPSTYLHPSVRSVRNASGTASPSPSTPESSGLLCTKLELSPVILLTQEDLAKRHPGLIGLLYDAFPRRCSQCGYRFSAEDRQGLDAHMDKHFRMKRRQRERGRKVQRQGWYTDEETWVASGNLASSLPGHEAAGQAGAGSGSTGDQGAGADGSAFNNNTPNSFAGNPSGSLPQVGGSGKGSDAHRSLNPSTQPSIRIPEGAGNGDDLACAVCLEKFDRYWHDSEEEWMLRDATVVPPSTEDKETVGGKVKLVHASCLVEFNKSQAVAKATGETETKKESTLSPVPIKRKWEDEEEESDQHISTPAVPVKQEPADHPALGDHLPSHLPTETPVKKRAI